MDMRVPLSDQSAEAVQTVLDDIDTMLETGVLYPELPHLDNRLALLFE